MLTFHDIEQNTDEWQLMRCGRLTSSNLGKIMAESRDHGVVELSKGSWAIVNSKLGKALKPRFTNKIDASNHLVEMKSSNKKITFGEPAKKLAVQIAVQQITGKVSQNGFSNEHTERGHEQEPIARMLYEERTFSKVNNGGFFSTKDQGCSPDGLVAMNGVVEIKSVIESTQFATVKRQNIDPAYKWQCIANMKFTERDWLDFVSYCADFPADNQLYIHRLHKADFTKEYEMIDSRVEQFMPLIQEAKELILTSSYCN